MKAKSSTKNLLTVSVLLALLALVAATAATTAWLSISDRGRVYTMALDVTTGLALRFDLEEHENFDDYKTTLGIDEIYAQINRELGFDPFNTKIIPVTTDDGETFTLEKGTVKEERDGAYLSFTLHFMASEDMIVHLSSENSDEAQDGTLISSDNEKLPPAMRLSFTHEEKTKIYDPGDGENTGINGKTEIFCLPNAEEMVYNKETALFSVKAYEDNPVRVHIWLEGKDKDCTDELRDSEYEIRLRFVGTDEDYSPKFGSDRSKRTEKTIMEDKD